MPEKWFGEDYADLRDECRIPTNVEFQTKNTMLSAMFSKIIASEHFKGRYIGVDSAFGRDHAFLDSIPQGYVCFADVPATQHVYLVRPDMVAPEYKGRGRKPFIEYAPIPSRTVEEIISDPGIRWRRVVLGIGAKRAAAAKDK